MDTFLIQECAGKGRQCAGKGHQCAGEGCQCAGKGRQCAGKGRQCAGKGHKERTCFRDYGLLSGRLPGVCGYLGSEDFMRLEDLKANCK